MPAFLSIRMFVQKNILGRCGIEIERKNRKTSTFFSVLKCQCLKNKQSHDQREMPMNPANHPKYRNKKDNKVKHAAPARPCWWKYINYWLSVPVSVCMGAGQKHTPFVVCFLCVCVCVSALVFIPWCIHTKSKQIHRIDHWMNCKSTNDNDNTKRNWM